MAINKDCSFLVIYISHIKFICIFLYCLICQKSKNPLFFLSLFLQIIYQMLTSMKKMKSMVGTSKKLQIILQFLSIHSEQLEDPAPLKTMPLWLKDNFHLCSVSPPRSLQNPGPDLHQNSPGKKEMAERKERGKDFQLKMIYSPFRPTETLKDTWGCFRDS